LTIVLNTKDIATKYELIIDLTTKLFCLWYISFMMPLNWKVSIHYY